MVNWREVMARQIKIAVIGGGGREAALVRAYAKSADSLLAIPGNDLMGIGLDIPVKTFPELKTTSVNEIISICRKDVTLVDVGQENAVESGLADRLRAAKIKVVGPTRLAGKIEWDKAFARELGTQHSMPQPKYRICYSEEEGIEYMKCLPKTPVFVKAVGLANGKGAIPARNYDEAVCAIKEMARFGRAGKTFLIEQWLCNEDGSNAEEFSTFAITDGSEIKILGSAQDHKCANNSDEGPNTGGMGCSTPPLVLNSSITSGVEGMFRTMINALNFNRKYNGILYLGGILQYKHGRTTPYIVEWNARWGDPEAQAIIPGIKTDMLELGLAAANGSIQHMDIETDGKARIVVAGVSKGYPGDYDAVSGKQIFGLDEAMKADGVEVYGAGVRVQDGKYYASGGRLFYVVGEGKDAIQAREKAYSAMSHISIEGNNLHYRDDIGWRDVARLRR